MKILTLSSLYPNENLPGRGSFVENKLKHLRVNSTIEHKVVSPVPHLPVIGQFLPSQKPFETVKKYECRGGFDVYYPKYLHIPGLSMNMGPRNMYKACKPILQRLINEGFDFDLIDSHYVYPDGVAAYYLAQYFNKPFTVTALGTDINILPGFDKPRERIIEALQSADGITAVSKDLCHKMVALGATRENIKASIGPCISQRSYEVGPEFFEQFANEDPDYTRFFINGNGDRLLFDLPSFCLFKLREETINQAHWIGHCTYLDESRFYSFRRATHRKEADYGRLISAIVL